jgi:adenylate cyclase
MAAVKWLTTPCKLSRVIKAALFGCAVGLTGVLISFFSLTHEIEEDIGLALLFKLRGVKEAPPEVVVVSIDRESSEALQLPNNPDRWPRSYHAKLISKLAEHGAAAIVFDLYFTEARAAGEEDALAEAIRRAGNVVLAELLKVKEIPASPRGRVPGQDHRIVQSVKPIDKISQAAFATAPFVLPRMPVRVNQYWTFLPDAGDSPTFPIVAFQLYALRVYGDFVRLMEKVRPNLAGTLPHDAAAEIRARGVVSFMKQIRRIFEADVFLGAAMLKELEHSSAITKKDEKNRLLKPLINVYGGAKRRYLNYYGPPRTVSTVPFHKAVAFGSNVSATADGDFRGKVVFVGLSENELVERHDSFHTVFSQENGVFISGVEIAATAVANLFDDRPVAPISTPAYISLILAWGVLIGFIGLILGTTAAALLMAGLSAVYIFFAEYYFTTNGAWVPIVVPLFVQAPVGLFGAILINYLETNKERQNIRNALSHYVPAEIVNQLARNRMDVRRGGETVYGICLFSDAAGYTSFSEKYNPQQLREVMNQYFEATFAPIRENGGLVVGVAGDSILAVWKAAAPERQLRKQACMAALGVAKAVTQFNESFTDVKLPVRLAVHCGEMFLGNIGAGEHYEYGVTGDTVNTASRMDGLNKFLGTQILVSEDVIHGLDGFLTREAGSFLLKGKSNPVTVHELKCSLDDSEETQKQACAVFAQGLRAFRARSWREAKEKFDHCIRILGDDPLSRHFLNLCKDYAAHPPDGSWSGVIAMEEK